MYTFDSSLPNSVGILEAQYDIIADLDHEFEAVKTSFLECKPQPFWVLALGDRKLHVRPIRRHDCQAQDFYIWLLILCKFISIIYVYRISIQKN